MKIYNLEKESGVMISGGKGGATSFSNEKQSRKFDRQCVTPRKIKKVKKIHVEDVKSIRKELHYKKVCNISMDTFSVPEHLERQILGFEKKHRRNTTVDDIAVIFDRIQMEPHSDEQGTIWVKIQDLLSCIKEEMKVDDIYITILETIFISLNILTRTSDIDIIVSTILLALKTIVHSSYFSLVTELVNSIFFKNIDEEKEPHSFEATKFFRNFNILKQSTFFEKVNNVISLIITFGFLDPVNFTIQGFKLYANEGISIAKLNNNIFEYIIDLVSYFFDVAVDLFNGKTEKLFTLNEMAAIEDDMIHLSSNIERVINGDYAEKTGKTVTAYQHRMMNTYSTLRYLVNNTTDKNLKTNLYGKIDKISKLIILYEQSQPLTGLRIAPFAFSIYGSSSVGKSTLVNIIMLSILKYNKYEHADSNICTLQSNDKFYSTYKADTTGVLLDDVANTKSVVSQVNPADMVISLVNNVMYYAPKAEASEKGKIKVQPKVVALTTNVKELESNYWSNEPISVLRRLEVHITATVKHEYATHGKLDNNKLTTSQLEEYAKSGIIDVWNITLEKVVPLSKEIGDGYEPYTFRVITKGDFKYENVDIYTALQYLNENSKKYFEKQNMMVQTNKNLGEKLSFCSECANVNIKCTCSEPHYDIVEKVINWTVDKTISSIFRKIDYFTSIITLSKWETLLYKPLSSYIVSHYIDDIVDKSASLVNIVPISVRESKLYEQLYLFSKRHNVHRCMMGLNVCAVGCYLNFVAFRPMLSVPRKIYIGLIAFPLLNAITGRFLVNNLKYRLRNENLQYNSNKNEYVDSIATKIFKVGVSCGTAYVVTRILKKLYHVVSSEVHGNLMPTDTQDIDERDKQTNPWMARQVEPFAYVAKTHSMSTPQLNNVVASNCLHMFYEDNKVLLKVSCLVLRSNIILAPYHFFFPSSDIYSTIFGGFENQKQIKLKFVRSENTNYTFKHTLKKEDIVRIGHHDLCIFKVHSGGVFTDLTQYMGAGDYSGPITMTSRNYLGEVKVMHGNTQPKSTFYLSKILRKKVDIKGGDVIYDSPTQRGMCTGVLITDTTKPTIMGFHIAGITGRNVGSYIRCEKSEIDKHIDTLITMSGNLECHSAGVFNPTRYNKDMNFQLELDERSPVNFIETHSYTIRGSIGNSSSYYSEVQNTFIHDDVVDFFSIDKRWGKPKFGPEKWKPWYNFLEIAANPGSNFDPILLKRAKDDYLKPLYKFMAVNAKDIRPLEDAQIINGIHGKRFIDSLNFQSSMGFPLSGSKSSYLTGDPGYFYFDDYPEIYEEIDKSNEAYLNDMRYYPVFKACLKDEPTDVTKDKVRVFQAADFCLQYQWRKYGLPILRFLSLYPLVSECAVGINPFSEEWNQLHNYVTFDGACNETILAGDYSKWDIRLPPDLVCMAFQVIICLAQSTGNYTEMDLKIMRGLATDTVYYLTHYNGTLLEMCSGVPSGHNLTAHINSIANSLLLRMFYFSIQKNTNFRTDCHVSTYGDDFFGGVRTTCPSLNHINYRDFLAKYDIILTMPDKSGGDPPPYMSIEVCDFLKRRSVLNVLDGKYYGALSLESLYKSLCVRTKIKISPRHHIVSVIEGVIRELSLWPPYVFNEHMVILRTLCAKHNLVPKGIYCDYEQYHFMIKNSEGVAVNNTLEENNGNQMIPRALSSFSLNSEHCVSSDLSGSDNECDVGDYI